MYSTYLAFKTIWYYIIKLISIWSNFVFPPLSICMNLPFTLTACLFLSKIYFVRSCLNWPLLCNIQRTFGVRSLKQEDDFRRLASAVYLQVSIISQALIFVTRSRSWSFVERPGLLLVAAFIVAQLVRLFLHLHFVILLYWYMENIDLLIFLLCAVCHTDCCLRKLEICCSSRDWMGLGWCYLAL